VRRWGSGDVMVRRGQVCAWDAGDRVLAPPRGARGLGLRLGRPLGSVACARTDEPVVALTFDDGPDPEHTAAVLDVLARHAATATFFVLVDRAEARPDLVRRMVADGHEVGLHGSDHTRLSTLPPLDAVRRIAGARRRLSRLIGRPVPLYRPTYGAQSVGQLVGSRALGLEVVLWSAWCRDWEEGDPDEIAARAVRAVHPGAFLLLHDACGDTEVGAATFSRSAMTEAICRGLDDGGWRTAPVGELLRRYPAVRTLWMSGAAPGTAAAPVAVPATAPATGSAA
jgi:peptidoglycan-N-acetylglucosamine deacetylase